MQPTRDGMQWVFLVQIPGLSSCQWYQGESCRIPQEVQVSAVTVGIQEPCRQIDLVCDWSRQWSKGVCGSGGMALWLRALNVLTKDRLDSQHPNGGLL